MEFFDMNVPYYESDRNITDKEKASRKATRLKLVVKAMELGYGGIAYNRILKGVMSDLDRCSIPLFPLSSLTKAAPSISSVVKLHRQVLGLPLAAPFRQFTRLTVVVDSSSQALALNSGNPILKSYDIIAVRPMNQSAFEQACQTSEVDIISINFSDKMPFRLKHPIVKAAIQRGVYFEITYSGLIMDAQTRRQLISNAKLLVDWTRGKNLIISSAASSVSEMRGPYDIANLSSLLGLSMERAKAALSKNCSALLTHAVRKKHYYKEAIRVELIPSTVHSDETKEKQFNEWCLNWDPISSGDGDLLLDDMKKSLSVSNLISKTVKAIDFASAMNSIASVIEYPSLVSEENTRDGLNSKPMDCANCVTSTDAQVSFPSNLTDVENAHVLEDTKMIPDVCIGLEDDKLKEVENTHGLEDTKMIPDLCIGLEDDKLKEVESTHVLEDTTMIPDVCIGLEDDQMEEVENTHVLEDTKIIQDVCIGLEDDKMEEAENTHVLEDTKMIPDVCIDLEDDKMDKVENTHVLEGTKMIPDVCTGLEDDKIEEDLILAATDLDEELSQREHIKITRCTTNVSSRPFIPESSDLHTIEKHGQVNVEAEEQRMEIIESKGMDMLVMEELTADKDGDSLNTDLATHELKNNEKQAETSSTITFDKFPGKIILKPRKRHRQSLLFPLRRSLIPINFKRKAKKSKTVIPLM